MELSASSVRNPAEEHRRAATGYLVWPLAFAEMVREGDAETIWARLHSRQAFVFGLLATVFFVVILAFPLLAVLAIPAISTGATISIYTGGLIADIVSALIIGLLALRFSARAARGDFFAIPLVTPIVDTLFRVRRP